MQTVEEIKYLYFTFDGVSSSRFNLIVQNQGEDLIFPSQPTFENQIITPLYQGATYLAGVQTKDRVFTFSCWVDSITTETVREMLNWLSVNKTGLLSLDYNPNFAYNVKVSNLSDLKHMDLNNDGTGNYEFSLSFITIGNGQAESIYEYNLNETDLIKNIVGPNFDNGGPIAFHYNDKFKLLNYYSGEFPLDITISGATEFDLKLNNMVYYSYEAEEAKTFQIDTKYGFARVINEDGSSSLAESIDGVQSNTNLGAMLIPSGDSKSFISQLIYWNDNTKTIIIDNSDGIISYSSEEAANGNLFLILQDGSYGDNIAIDEPDSNSVIIWTQEELEWEATH